MQVNVASTVLALLAASLILYPVATAPPGQDYSIYNTEWNGCSLLKTIAEGEGYQVRTIISTMHFLSRLEGSAVLIIVGSTKAFTSSEVVAVMEFVRKGGALLLADDKGFSNVLASKLGFSFDGTPLLDVGSYTKNPNYPVVALKETHNLSRGVSYIVLNHPTGLHIGVPPEGMYDAVVVAQSSSTSWLDKNRNERWDVGEEVEGFIPVVVAFQLELGRVILVSDPTMFTNDMIQYGDNMIFAANVIRWLSRESTSFPVLFDVTHLQMLQDAPGLLAWVFSWVVPQLTILGPASIVALFVLLSLLATKFPPPREREEGYVRPKSFFEHRMAVMTPPWALYYLYKAFRRRLTKKLNLPPSADTPLIMAKVRETFPHHAYQVGGLLREFDDLTSPLRNAQPPWKREYVPSLNVTPFDLYIAGEITWEELKFLDSQPKMVGWFFPYVSLTEKGFINLVWRLTNLLKELGL